MIAFLLYTIEIINVLGYICQETHHHDQVLCFEELFIIKNPSITLLNKMSILANSTGKSEIEVKKIVNTVLAII